MKVVMTVLGVMTVVGSVMAAISNGYDHRVEWFVSQVAGVCANHPESQAHKVLDNDGGFFITFDCQSGSEVVKAPFQFYKASIASRIFTGEMTFEHRGDWLVPKTIRHPHTWAKWPR